LLFALKLAEFEMLKSKKGFAPLLLLDDVFEKLDESRMHNLLDWVCVQNDGQIFITDTHRERIVNHLEKLSACIPAHRSVIFCYLRTWVNFQ
jgi:DNA replication and repair protein RecF